jgi:hypothetical protein
MLTFTKDRNTKSFFLKNFITLKSSFHFSLFSKADRGENEKKMKDFF